MLRPIHFEIPVDNLDRAIDFYSNLFGWKFTKWDGPVDYWLISTGDPKEPGMTEVYCGAAILRNRA